MGSAPSVRPYQPPPQFIKAVTQYWEEIKMNQIRLVLLSIGALLALAMLPGVAQASLFTWIVLDSGGTALESLKAELGTEVDSKDLTLLTHISGLTVAITCTGSKLIGINLEAEGKLTEGGRARFEGCEAYGKGSLEEALKCKISSAGTGTGIVETGQLKGELLLHELAGGGTELLTKVEPKEGTTLAVLLTEGCVLPEANSLHGKLFVKNSESKGEAHAIKHLVEQGPLTSLWVGEDSKEHLETSIDGSMWVVLSGAHKGLSWAGKHNLEIVTGLSWLVLNSVGTEAKALKALLQGEKDSTHLVLLTTISNLMLSIVCTNFELIGVNLETGGTLTTGGSVKFTGCEVYSGTFTNPPLSNVLTTTKLPCTLSTSGQAAGTIATNKLKGKLVLNVSKEVLMEVAPETGTSVATFLFKGSECILPEEDPITGTFFFKDCENKILVHAVKHLIEEGPGTSFKLGTSTATLLGSGWIKLGGEHIGLSWAAMDA
jgi:hypothetical protein